MEWILLSFLTFSNNLRHAPALCLVLCSFLSQAALQRALDAMRWTFSSNLQRTLPATLWTSQATGNTLLIPHFQLTFSSNLQHALGANLFGPSTFWNNSKEVPWHYVPKFLKQLEGSWCYALNYLKQHVTRSWCYALVLKQPRNTLLMLLLSCAQPYGCGGFWHGTRITRCYCSKSCLQGINVHFCCQ